MKIYTISQTWEREASGYHSSESTYFYRKESNVISVFTQMFNNIKEGRFFVKIEGVDYIIVDHTMDKQMRPVQIIVERWCNGELTHTITFLRSVEVTED